MNDERFAKLRQFRSTPLEQVAAWPPADLTRLADEVSAAVQEAKMAKAFFERVLTEMTIRHLNQVELSRRWGISHRTLERWRSHGEGPSYIKIGGRVVCLADPTPYETSFRRHHRHRSRLGQSEEGHSTRELWSLDPGRV